jgi:hypothetical protein
VECFVAEPTVPPGFAVIDTAALAACAGDRALQRHEKLINQSLKEEPSSTVFRGINSAAPIKSRAKVHVPGGIEGRGCTLRFEKLPDSDAPLLMSAGQLQDLGAEIYTAQKKVMFRRLSDEPMDIETSEKGHMMIDITKFPSKRRLKPTFRAKEVDVWTATGEVDEMIPRGICTERCERNSRQC